MNRFIKNLLIVSLAALAMAGCSGKKQLDMEKFTTAVMENVTYDDEMIKVPQKTAETLYNLNFEGLEGYTLYTSATAATANELMVMKVKDSKAEAKAKEAIEARKKDLINLYENYRPEEMKKLNDTLVVSEGGCVIFSVSGDNSMIQKYIDENVK